MDPFEQVDVVSGPDGQTVFYTFGLRDCSLVICAICGVMHHILENDTKCGYHYFQSHWRNAQASSHDKRLMMSKGTAAQWVTNALGKDSKLPTKPRNPILKESLVSSLPATLEVKEEEALLCLVCLTEVTQKEAFCCNIWQGNKAMRCKVFKQGSRIFKVPFFSDDKYMAEVYAWRESVDYLLNTLDQEATQRNADDHMCYAENFVAALRTDKSETIAVKKAGRFAAYHEKLTNVEAETLSVMGFEAGVSMSERIRMSDISGPIRKSNERDKAFLCAAENILAVDKSIEHVRSHEVSDIILVAKFDSLMPQHVDDDGITERRLSVKGQFFPSLKELGLRAARLARVFRVAYSVWPSVADALEVGIASVLDDDDGQSLKGVYFNWAYSLMRRLLKQYSMNVEDLVRNFAFQRCRAESASKSDESDDEEEEDEEEGSVSSVKVTSGSQLRRICGAILHGLKCTLIHELASLRIRHANGEPFLLDKSFMAETVSSGNAANLAHLAARFTAISAVQSTTTRNDSHYMKDDQERIVMRLDHGIVLTPDDHRTCGRRVFGMLQSALKDVCLFADAQHTDEQLQVFHELESAIFGLDAISESRFAWEEHEHGPRLAASCSARAWLRRLLTDRETSDLDFCRKADRLRKLIIMCVHLFGGAILRMPELSSLRRGNRYTSGNLMSTESWDGLKTIGYSDIISKTGKKGGGLMPWWLARVTLLYFDEIALTCSKQLANEWEQEMETSTEGQSWSDVIQQITREVLQSELGFAPLLSKKFIDKAKKSTWEQVTANVPEDEILFQLEGFIEYDDGSTLSATVFDLICRAGYGKVKLSCPMLRKVLINVKTFAMDVMGPIESIRDPEVRASVEYIEGKVGSHGRKMLQLNAFVGVGQHSKQTLFDSYLVKAGLAGGTESVPELWMSTLRIATEFAGMVFGGPTVAGRAVSDKSEVELSLIKPLTMSTMQTIRNRRRELNQGELEDSPKALMLHLMAEATDSKRTAFLDSYQERAVRRRFMYAEDCVIRYPCGTGKTFLMAVNAIIAPYGVTFVSVPTKALLHSMLDDIKRDFPFASVKSFDEILERYSPPMVWKDWDRANATRVIIGTIDALLQPRAQAIMNAVRGKGLMNGIVIDEVQTIFEAADYRMVMQKAWQLGAFGAPLTLMSGTLRDFEVDALKEVFALGIDRPYNAFWRETAYAGRRIVDVLRFDDPHQVGRWVKNVIQQWESKCGQTDKRPILVFAMTRAQVVDTKQHLTLLGNHTVFELTSQTPIGDNEAMLRAMKSKETRTIVVSTSVGAAGIDFPDVGLVVVLYGAYGGVTEFHQMASRCGRPGATSLELSSNPLTPRVILLYAPTAAAKECFPDKTIAQQEATLLLSFPEGKVRDKAKSQVGYASLETMVTNGERCGMRAVEKQLGTKNLS